MKKKREILVKTGVHDLVNWFKINIWVNKSVKEAEFKYGTIFNYHTPIILKTTRGIVKIPVVYLTRIYSLVAVYVVIDDKDVGLNPYSPNYKNEKIQLYLSLGKEIAEFFGWHKYRIWQYRDGMIIGKVGRNNYAWWLLFILVSEYDDFNKRNFERIY